MSDEADAGRRERPLRGMSLPWISIPWLPLLFGAWSAAIAMAPGIAVKALLAAPALLLPALWWMLQNPARWLALFFGAALLLPPLPIPIGDSGPHPSLLFAALGL